MAQHETNSRPISDQLKMLLSTATFREYSERSESKPKEADCFSARGDQTKNAVRIKSRDPASDNDLSDSQVEEEKETGADENTEEDEPIQEGRGWLDQTMVEFSELGVPTTKFDSMQHPELPLTTTISDDRSHDSKFQQDVAGHLLNALGRQRPRQPQELQSGRSRNHGAIGQSGRRSEYPQSWGFAKLPNQSPAVQQQAEQMYDANLRAQQNRLAQPQTIPRPPSVPALTASRSRKRDSAEADTAAQQPTFTSPGQQNKKRRMRAQHEDNDESSELPPESPVSPKFHEDSEESMNLIANALGIPAEAATSLVTLQSYIAELQGNSRPHKLDRHQIIHRVKEKESSDWLYFDRPHCLRNEGSSKMSVAGNRPVSDLSLYLAKNPEVSFIVYRDYTPTTSNDEYFADDDFEDTLQLKHSHESLVMVTKELADAVSSFLKHLCGITTEYKGNVTLWSPYVAVYHNRGHQLGSFLTSLRQRQRVQFQLLLDHIMSQYSREWAIVDNLIKRRKITSEYIMYLYKPGDVVVNGKLQNARGYLCKSWPRRTHGSQKARGTGMKTCDIEVSRWDYDNGFIQRNSRLDLSVKSNDMPEMDIAHLSVRPLRLMDGTTQETLRFRGNRIWKCRTRCLVSYHEDATRENHYSSDDRYMIDMAMYYKLHRPVEVWSGAGELDPEVMKQDEPPDDHKYPAFTYLLPPTIKAFNLKSKKWVDLQVDRIGDVVWNDEAFQSLVIKEKTKQLIQALVSNHIEAEKSTDVISGKGNGLIMLLHGGPGTGKTLTAESVAEIARRPLYPVTCGDIGTEPGRVETYLESVFHIGKTWGCVVLLDEADVFLEERSFENLQRNALVSVFLRALEYYDGILILTSNRVGHFDEAFKSRIQLAIRYKPLDRDQRTEIWKNFIRRLETLQEDDIDFADLKDHVPELAEKEMNGREIRNAITTGRQFVKWKRQQPNGGNCLLNYDMLNGDVLQPVAEFDEYLGELYGGNSSEQLARQDGKR